MGINREKTRDPSAFPPISTQMIYSLGQVASFWSLFEQHFEVALERLIILNENDDEDWRERLRGKKRRKRLLIEARQFFAGHEVFVHFLEETIGYANRLSKARNALLHGKIIHRFRGPSNNLKFWIEVESKDGKWSYTAEELEDLAYHIAHLAGLMSYITADPNENEQLSSQDRQRLQDFQASNHPNLPNLAKPQVQLPEPDGATVHIYGGGDPPNVVR